MKLSVRYQILFLAFLVLALYYPALFAEICTVDDERMLTRLLNMDTFSLKGVFFPAGAYYYRPLLGLTFILDKYLWGLHESFMHLENFLLHACNTLLVFGAARFLGKRWRSDSPATLPFLAALLFAVHPIATESVNWISGRTDLLSGTFLFLALFLLLWGAGRGAHLLIFAAALSFLAACLSKDSAVAAFPALLILACSVLRGAESDRLRPAAYLWFTGSTLSYFLLRHLANRGGDSGLGGVAGAVTAGDAGLVDKGRIVLKVLGFYTKKLFLPWPLNFAITQVSDLYAVVGVLTLLVCGVLLFKPGLPGKLLLLAASTVVPALLVPLGPLTWTPMAERYLYMSSAPFCMALTFLGYSGWQRLNRPRFLAGSGVLLIALFACSTAQRTLLWQHNLTFFQDAVQKNPGFVPIRNELALALERAGRRDESIRIYQSNIMSNSDKYSIVTDLNRARSFLAQGQPERAREILLAKKYDRSKPLYADYLEVLISIDERELLRPVWQGRAEVEREVRDSLLTLAEVTGDPLQYYRIGKKFLGLGMKAEAGKYFALAYEKSPEGAFYKLSARKLADKCRVGGA